MAAGLHFSFCDTSQFSEQKLSDRVQTIQNRTDVLITSADETPFRAETSPFAGLQVPVNRDTSLPPNASVQQECLFLSVHFLGCRIGRKTFAC